MQRQDDTSSCESVLDLEMIWNCLWAEFCMRELFVKSARASLQVCCGSTRELGPRWCDCTQLDSQTSEIRKLIENSKSFLNEFACKREALHWYWLSAFVETWGRQVLHFLTLAFGLQPIWKKAPSNIEEKSRTSKRFSIVSFGRNWRQTWATYSYISFWLTTNLKESTQQHSRSV